ncbi:MAG: PAS domain S-box protein [Deltaproteobacteria bacterium]|jgi:PAS domain S-box-containing protein|nr:PAS domain S-box protein [Deltaproteobacteria bacterium]MBW2489091.1 PAS domain S-box protein [Deltaproteobacteria bacterium]
MDSFVVAGIALAALYWVCESFMYFFLEPEANFIQHLLGPNRFEVFTRLLVLCLFAVFTSHFQHTYNKRRLADKALLESETKYRAIVEGLEEGYFEIDLNGNLSFFNDPLCKILGYARRDLEGKNINTFTAPNTIRKMNEIYTQVKKTGEPIRVTDYDALGKDGREIALELTASLLRDTSDTPVGFRGVLRDVSDRKEAEAEKKKLEIQVQQAQKMESIGTLAGGIAHDFNNILMGIQGNASLMAIKTDASHPSYEKIKNIETYVENGTELTRQLLGFARRGKYHAITTDINDVIEKSARMFGRTKKEIRIHLDLVPDIWTVEVDRGQIEQALLNLYVNAWQAMPDGGNLSLKTENVVLGVDFINSQPYKVEAGDYIKITVTDSGIGIDKQTQARIFEPFFTTKEMGRGTGLGLASVYGIIKNHGGYINVYSESGQGTTFTIYLPASAKVIQPEVRTVTPIVVTGNGIILLIDDEKMIIDVGRELLQELGYDVLTASSGREAIEVYRQKHAQVDLVIMDLIMPGLSGGETYDRLKEINTDVKVLLSSGYSINGQAAKIMERGCDGFIQKPFNINQLSEKIQSIIAKK